MWDEGDFLEEEGPSELSFEEWEGLLSKEVKPQP